MLDRYIDECMVSIHNVNNNIKTLPDWYQNCKTNIYLHLVDITRWENLVHPRHYLGQFHPRSNITVTLE